MTETLIKEKTLDIDKSDWETVQFGEVVDEPRETVKDFEGDDPFYVLGLEHIESEDIHIRSYKTTEESTSFTRLFREEDVLFGRRRAYLKKAALAHFSGICSGDIIVMRAKEDHLMPELLPFIVNNDKFFDYAVKHSAGGLSPRVKFKDLAKFEIQIPAKEKQVQLAELLWALDEVIEKKKRAKDRYETLFKKYLFDEVSGKSSDKCDSWQEYKLKDISTSLSGLSGKSKNDFGSGKPFVTYMNVFSNSKINPKQYDLVEVEDGESQAQLQYGDILLTGSSETPEEVGMSSVVLDNIEGYYLNSFCYGFRLNDFNVLLPEFARFLFRGQEVRNFMFKHAQGSTRFNLSKSTVKKKLVLRLPSISEQKKIAENLESMVKIVKKFGKTIENSKRFQRSLINQIF